MTKSKSIPFTKMHGIGNDFVVINALSTPFNSTQLAISELADRHVGIGFDQLLLIEASKQADYFCRIYNADGSEAEQCGNGLRCIARYLDEEGIDTRKRFQIETLAGVFPIELKDYEHIRVTLSVPQIGESLFQLSLNQNALVIPISILSLGNPHAIIKVDSIQQVPTHELGPQVSTHAQFPHGANVGFMQIIDKNNIHLRTFERGAGETLACGSNACAAVAAGIVNGWLDKKVTVNFRYGSLHIEWQGGNHPVIMTGPAAKIFSGEIFR